MVVLGSTGSIGVNALNIARKFSLPIKALSAGSNIALLNQQIAEFNPQYVCIGDASLKEKINHKNVFTGADGTLELLNLSFTKGATLVNALVGFTGLSPTFFASKLGYKIALANKESLVAGGEFVDTACITPVDSEHFGIWYLLNDRTPTKITITASGGALRNTPLEQMCNMKSLDVLKHPNWKMGQKITVDSATMMNKLFEILEAKWLFKCNKIDAIIEPKSIIHAFVDFIDGSTTAHFANTDMRLPIAYALLGKVDEEILTPIDLLQIKELNFKSICTSRYPLWELKETLMQKPYLGVILNAANDVMVNLFLHEKINFTDISKNILVSLKEFENVKPSCVEDIFLINNEVKDFCKQF